MRSPWLDLFLAIIWLTLALVAHHNGLADGWSFAFAFFAGERWQAFGTAMNRGGR